MIDIKKIDKGLVNFCLFAYCDMISYEETISDKKWIQVINEEIQLIEKNNTWKLIVLSIRKKPIGVKWIYKKNYKPNSKVDQFFWLQKAINKSHALIILKFLHQLLDRIPFA